MANNYLAKKIRNTWGKWKKREGSRSRSRRSSRPNKSPSQRQRSESHSQSLKTTHSSHKSPPTLLTRTPKAGKKKSTVPTRLALFSCFGTPPREHKARNTQSALGNASPSRTPHPAANPEEEEEEGAYHREAPRSSSPSSSASSHSSSASKSSMLRFELPAAPSTKASDNDEPLASSGRPRSPSKTESFRTCLTAQSSRYIEDNMSPQQHHMQQTSPYVRYNMTPTPVTQTSHERELYRDMYRGVRQEREEEHRFTFSYYDDEEEEEEENQGYNESEEDEDIVDRDSILVSPASAHNAQSPLGVAYSCCSSQTAHTATSATHAAEERGEPEPCVALADALFDRASIVEEDGARNDDRGDEGAPAQRAVQPAAHHPDPSAGEDEETVQEDEATALLQTQQQQQEQDMKGSTFECHPIIKKSEFMQKLDALGCQDALSQQMEADRSDQILRIYHSLPNQTTTFDDDERAPEPEDLAGLALLPMHHQDTLEDDDHDDHDDMQPSNGILVGIHDALEDEDDDIKHQDTHFDVENMCPNPTLVLAAASSSSPLHSHSPSHSRSALDGNEESQVVLNDVDDLPDDQDDPEPSQDHASVPSPSPDVFKRKKRKKEAYGGVFDDTTAFYDKYVIGAKLNEGGFGSVWRIVDHNLYARCVKIMDLGADEHTRARRRKACVREYHMTRKAFSDEIVEVELYVDSIAHPDAKAYLVQPFFEGQDLFEFIDSDDYVKRVSVDDMLHIFYKIAEKLYDLHYFKKMVHGDIKPENVMILSQEREDERNVDQDIEVEIVDYGIAKNVRGLNGHTRFLESKGHFGTKGYVAPELMRDGMFNRKIDVFSVGVVLYNMVTECCLFPKGHKYYRMSEEEYYKYLKRKFRPFRKKKKVTNILYSCLAYKPEDRLDVKQMMKKFFCE